MVSCTNLKYSAPYLPCMPSGYSSIPLTSMPTTNRPEGTVLKLVGTINFKTINVIKKKQNYVFAMHIFLKKEPTELREATFLPKMVGTNSNPPLMFRRACMM